MDIWEQHEMPSQVSKIDSHIARIAGYNPYHPVVEWIEQQEWDQVSRIDDFIRIFKLPVSTSKAERELVAMYCRKWLIQCVAALYRTDFRLQGILTLVGGQGTKKSSLWRTLTPDVSWVKSDVSVDPHNKDSVFQAIQYWIIELGEVDAMLRKADVSAIKLWSSAEHDELRLPYDHKPEKYKRQTSMAASVNDAEFLTDNENRRWWNISVESINLEHGIDIPQLWAEAKVLFDKGDPYWLTPEELNKVNSCNNNYIKTSTITDKLTQYGAYKANHNDWVNRKNATEILEHVGIENPRRSDRDECTRWLKMNGYVLHKNNYKWEIAFDPTLYVDVEPRSADIMGELRTKH